MRKITELLAVLAALASCAAAESVRGAVCGIIKKCC